MAWSFNPFTGNLDLVGGGSVVFEGEVETFADLPQTIGDPPPGSSYLVRTSTGVWLVNRKQAGIWIRNPNNTGVRENDWTYGGDYPVNSVNGQTGTVSLTASSVGAESIFDASSLTLSGTPVTLTAARARVWTFVCFGATTVTLPTTDVQLGDRIIVRGGTPVVATISISSSGVSDTITLIDQQFSYTYLSTGTGNRWVKNLVDSHDTGRVTSGIFNNARIDWGSPSAIGGTTPNTAAFTSLSATTQINGPNATASPPTTTGQARGLQFGFLGGNTGSTAAIYGSHPGTSTLGIGIANSSVGSITQVAAFTSTGLSVNGGTVTASAPVLDLAQTWNNSGVTFTGFRANITDTQSAAASVLASLQTGGVRQLAVTKTGDIQFKDNTSGGLTTNPVIFDFGSNQYWCHLRFAGSNLFTFQQNGNFTIGTGGLLVLDGNSIRREGNRGLIQWDTTSTSTNDAVIISGQTAFPSTNFAVRNGTNPQTFRIYNTFTDASNHERGFMRWSSNVLQIGTEKAGTGSARALEFQTDGVTRMTIANDGNITMGNFAAFTLGTNGFVNAPAGVLGMTAALWNNQLRVSGSGVVAWYTAQWNAVSTDLEIARDAADTLAQRRAGNAQTFRIYNTFTSTTNFERLNIRWASNECIIDAQAGGGGGTLRGIKIGSATSSLLGFYGVTPVDQPATVADPAGGGTVDAEARTAINAVIDRLQELGLIA